MYDSVITSWYSKVNSEHNGNFEIKELRLIITEAVKAAVISSLDL